MQISHGVQLCSVTVRVMWTQLFPEEAHEDEYGDGWIDEALDNFPTQEAFESLEEMISLPRFGATGGTQRSGKTSASSSPSKMKQGPSSGTLCASPQKSANSASISTGLSSSSSSSSTTTSAAVGLSSDKTSTSASQGLLTSSPSQSSQELPHSVRRALAVLTDSLETDSLNSLGSMSLTAAGNTSATATSTSTSTVALVLNNSPSSTSPYKFLPVPKIPVHRNSLARSPTYTPYSTRSRVNSSAMVLDPIDATSAHMSPGLPSPSPDKESTALPHSLTHDAHGSDSDVNYGDLTTARVTAGFSLSPPVSLTVPGLQTTDTVGVGAASGVLLACAALYRAALCCVALCCMCCAVLYCNVLCCVALCYIMMYFMLY